MTGLTVALTNIIEQIKQAQQPVNIKGGGSKQFLGNDLGHLQPLAVQALNGVVRYEPTELVLQVQAGTPVQDVIELLDTEGQMLAFEPPVFDGQATIGGMVAAGISGSRRPYSGAVRDYILGVDIVTGLGEHLSFGGQVIKNVAGYDVSRLLAGSMGCLGVITEVSFKVLPKPEFEQTQAIELDRSVALQQMFSLARSSTVTACAFYNNQLYIRFSGMLSSVQAEAAEFGGETVGAGFWHSIDNLTLFKAAKNLWRISVAPNSPHFVDEAVLIDWGGAQRWLLDPGFDPREKLTQNGHAVLVWGSQTEDKFQPIEGVPLTLHKGLKKQFDPDALLNPNKMYQAF